MHSELHLIQHALHAVGFLGSSVNDFRANRAVVSGRILDFLGLTSASKGRFTMKELTAAVHPEDQEWLREVFGRTVVVGSHLVLEYRVLARSGECRWLHERATVTGVDAQGHLKKKIGVFFDVTDFRAAGGRAMSNYKASLADPMGELVEGLRVATSAARQLQLDDMDEDLTPLAMHAIHLRTSARPPMAVGFDEADRY